MNLKPITQSEVSQKEKDIIYINIDYIYIYVYMEFRKMVPMILHVGQ